MAVVLIVVLHIVNVVVQYRTIVDVVSREGSRVVLVVIVSWQYIAVCGVNELISRV